MRLSPSMPSFRSLQSFETESSPAASFVGSKSMVRSHRPFAGLVICVTGLSKGSLSMTTASDFFTFRFPLLFPFDLNSYMKGEKRNLVFVIPFI